MDSRTVFTPPVTLRRYNLPNKKGEGWGVFVLGSDGFFSAVSDYGNYAFAWLFAGMEFRQFLLGCDWHYIATKLSQGREGPWNEDRTVANIKDHILQVRRASDYSKERARKEWDLLRSHDFSSTYGFSEWLNDTRIGDAYELSRRDDFDASLTAFVKVLLPRLKELLRAELAAEAGPTAEAVQ